MSFASEPLGLAWFWYPLQLLVGQCVRCPGRVAGRGRVMAEPAESQEDYQTSELGHGRERCSHKTRVRIPKLGKTPKLLPHARE